MASGAKLCSISFNWLCSLSLRADHEVLVFHHFGRLAFSKLTGGEKTKSVQYYKLTKLRKSATKTLTSFVRQELCLTRFFQTLEERLSRRICLVITSLSQTQGRLSELHVTCKPRYGPKLNYWGLKSQPLIWIGEGVRPVPVWRCWIFVFSCKSVGHKIEKNFFVVRIIYLR